MIDYTPLWRTMKERNITQYSLLEQGVDNRLLDTLKKNNNINLFTLEKICRIIDCTPNDIVCFSDKPPDIALQRKLRQRKAGRKKKQL